MTSRLSRALALVGPGILVAATGVGAGDLATAAFSGQELGVAVLWAVVFGAALKYVLNEGLTRWQLVTGTTLLEGAMTRLGPTLRIAFLAYLAFWTFCVATALMSACGAAAHAILPLFESARNDKILYGILHSLAGVALVRIGGFALFERVMAVSIAFMFVTVTTTAVLLDPSWGDLLRGLVVPRIPRLGDGGLEWTIALIGGVGGTVTVLCYGYWIRESGRRGVDALRACRIDLGVGYGMTALFGVAMVVIGSTIEVDGRGVGLIVALAARLGEVLGPAGRWCFLLGAWGAVMSSLLGVWQSVPYLFVDTWRLRSGRDAGGESAATESPIYRRYLLALATIPAIGLYWNFARVQQVYAIVGALFMPALAVTLLVLNRRRGPVGPEYGNRPATSAALILTLLFFVAAFGFVVAGLIDVS